MYPSGIVRIMSTTPEGEATKEVRLGASSLNMKLLRNNNGALLDKMGRLVRYGLGNESKKHNDEMKFGDLVGGTTITITPEMVGKEICVLTMFEVKTPEKLKPSIRKAMKHSKSHEAGQLRAIEFIRSIGGIAWFASCADDVKAVYEIFMRELQK